MPPSHLGSAPKGRRRHAGKPRTESPKLDRPTTAEPECVLTHLRRSGAVSAETPSIGPGWAGKLVPRQGLPLGFRARQQAPVRCSGTGINFPTLFSRDSGFPLLMLRPSKRASWPQAGKGPVAAPRSRYEPSLQPFTPHEPSAKHRYRGRRAPAYALQASPPQERLGEEALVLREHHR